MNFYSLDGTKTDSNNLFENKQLYERFDNTPNLSSQLDNMIYNNHEFTSVPTTKSKATDNNYQCSDGYTVKGNTLGKEFKGVSLNDCKNMCGASNDCIGFNYNTSKNVCTLKKDASSLMDTNKSSTLCIKKSAGNSNCGVNNSKSDDNKAFDELDLIFNNNSNKNQNNIPTGNKPISNKLTGNKPINDIPTGNKPFSDIPTGNKPFSDMLSSNQNYPLEIPYVDTGFSDDINVFTEIMPESVSNQQNNVNQPNNVNQANMGNNPSGVYVDLDCFMKNINVLQNHTDNTMVDLSLLLSNIKTCSYVKKTSTNSNILSGSNISTETNLTSSNNSSDKMDTNQLINNITSKINIPVPDVVKLKNVKADILVSNNNSQIFEMTKEPFDSESKSQSSNWSSQDLVLLIVLVILLYFIFRK